MSLRNLAVLGAAVVMSALMPATADAATTAKPSGAEHRQHRLVCVPVHATGVGNDLGGGHTTATITSHGVTLGSSEATFAEGKPDASGVVPFHGPIVITLAPGTLTVQVNGRFDITTGKFVARSSSLSGTGFLSGVTGRLTFRGTEDLASSDFSFTEKIKGRLCARLGS